MLVVTLSKGIRLIILYIYKLKINAIEICAHGYKIHSTPPQIAERIFERKRQDTPVCLVVCARMFL